MVRAAVNQLQTTPLNVTVTLRTTMMCQSLCLGTDKYAYMTFSQSSCTCTLYTTGTITINVAGQLVYELEAKKIEVHSACSQSLVCSIPDFIRLINNIEKLILQEIKF